MITTPEKIPIAPKDLLALEALTQPETVFMKFRNMVVPPPDHFIDREIEVNKHLIAQDVISRAGIAVDVGVTSDAQARLRARETIEAVIDTSGQILYYMFPSPVQGEDLTPVFSMLEKLVRARSEREQELGEAGDQQVIQRCAMFTPDLVQSLRSGYESKWRQDAIARENQRQVLLDTQEETRRAEISASLQSRLTALGIDIEPDMPLESLVDYSVQAVLQPLEPYIQKRQAKLQGQGDDPAKGIRGAVKDVYVFVCDLLRSPLVSDQDKREIIQNRFFQDLQAADPAIPNAAIIGLTTNTYQSIAGTLDQLGMKDIFQPYAYSILEKSFTHHQISEEATYGLLKMLQFLTVNTPLSAQLESSLVEYFAASTGDSPPSVVSGLKDALTAQLLAASRNGQASEKMQTLIGLKNRMSSADQFLSFEWVKFMESIVFNAYGQTPTGVWLDERVNHEFREAFSANIGEFLPSMNRASIELIWKSRYEDTRSLKEIPEFIPAWMGTTLDHPYTTHLPLSKGIVPKTQQQSTLSLFRSPDVPLQIKQRIYDQLRTHFEGQKDYLLAAYKHADEDMLLIIDDCMDTLGFINELKPHLF